MSDLRTLGRGQGRQLEDFRSSEEARLLARLAQTECLLDLAKLPGLRTDLPSYAGLVVGIVTQFVPSKSCSISIDVPDVPTISTHYGPLVSPAPAGAAQALVLDEAVVGELVVVPEVDQLCPAEFITQIAEQVSSSLGALVEAERLRRQAAISQTVHFIELLSDRPETDDLTQLVSALASLPNALGARLEIAHLAIGGAVSLTAGAPPDERPEPIPVPGGSVGVAIRWATPDNPNDSNNLDEIVNLISVALGKAEERQQLRDQAETDPLTGVGNRRRAMRSLAAAISLAERNDDQVGVVFLDLDHFKRVNDTHGHDVGDKVLFSFAQHLLGSVRAYDTVNRIGGEEFVIVCPGLDERGGETLARRIVAATPRACAGALPEGWQQTASAGVACYPRSASLSEGLLQAADHAMYLAKDAGRNGVRVATSSEPATR